MSKEKPKMTLSDLYRQYPLAILFIEDKDDYANELYKRGKPYHFELTHVSSLDEAKDLLSTEGGKDIRGIILDIRCMRKKDQKEWDKSFFEAALDYFRRTWPALPVVAITGYSEEYNKVTQTHHEVIRIFSKGGEEEQMFEYLRNVALDPRKLEIRYNYQDIFETIDKHFNKESEEMLVSCIKNMDSEKEEVMTGTLANLRKLQEGVYIALHRINKEMVPGELIFDKNGNPNVDNENIIKHLEGKYDRAKMKETTTAYVKHRSYEDRLLYFVYKGCSGDLHLSPQRTSRYTVQALVYAFLDMVLWLRRLGQGKQ